MQKITRKEISKLPINSIVRVHSVDRYGLPQYMDIYILKVKGHKGYYYRNYNGLHVKYYIPYFKDNDAWRYYELVKRGEEDD